MIIMTCKDCVHYGICNCDVHFGFSGIQHQDSTSVETDCGAFKNKADFVEVKHGRWETRNFIIFDSEKVGYRCSECKTTWDTETNYCPYCGADMGKEGASDENSL
jgi:rRNA maturation endonuclease Nob1